MELQNVVYEKSEGVGTITLNRPGKLNAITFEMLDEMWRALQDIQEDGDVRVVVLTGSGRYFSAGADLGIVEAITPETFRIRQRKYWNRVFGEFEDIQKLTIAALNGPALGGGVELALCCDLRYAVEEATLAFPQINFGILPDSGGTVRLPWLIGLARAKQHIILQRHPGSQRVDLLPQWPTLFPDDGQNVDVRPTFAVPTGFRSEQNHLEDLAGKALVQSSQIGVDGTLLPPYQSKAAVGEFYTPPKADSPPSTTRVVPCTKGAASDSNSRAGAIRSSGWPKRAMGV